MSLYDDLDLKGPDVSPDEIKKAFRKISLGCHPDKKGNEEKYKQIVAAYEILRDPVKKLEYDRSMASGLRGLGGKSVPGKSEISEVPDIIDLGTYVYHHLRRAYSSLNHRKFTVYSYSDLRSSTPSPINTHDGKSHDDKETTPPLEREIKITLEDLYNCTKKRLKITKQEVCEACNGQGGTQKKCVECNGQYKVCERCDMKGFQLDPVCIVCDGKQYTTVPKHITINLAPGINPDIPIDIRGVVDKNSLLRICLIELPHTKYWRWGTDTPYKGRAEEGGFGEHSSPGEEKGGLKTEGVATGSLVMRLDISIFDALGNFKHLHRHLDNEEYVFVYKDVIPPGRILRARNMGLLRKKDKIRGDLFIEFNHVWPASINKEDAQLALKKATAAVLNVETGSFISDKQKLVFLE